MSGLGLNEQKKLVTVKLGKKKGSPGSLRWAAAEAENKVNRGSAAGRVWSAARRDRQGGKMLLNPRSRCCFFPLVAADEQ